MTRLLVLFCVVGAVFCNKQDECLLETKLDKDGLYNVLTNEETPLDDEYGKFFVCFWHKQNVMNQDNTINFKGLQEFGEAEINIIRDVTSADQRQLKDKYAACKLKKLPVPEETAIEIKNCHLKTIVEVL